MTLQTSGAISFADLQTEFGGSHPITMHEYAPGYLGIGSGVEVSLDDFYGQYRRPLAQSRLSYDTNGTSHCRVDNGYVSTTATNTSGQTGNLGNNAVSMSLNVSAGDEVMVTVYAYNAWNAVSGSLGGMWARSNIGSNISISNTGWINLGNDPGVGTLGTTTYSSGADYIPYATSNPAQIYTLSDVDSGEYYQWYFKISVTSAMIQTNHAIFCGAYLGNFVFKGYEITFT